MRRSDVRRMVSDMKTLTMRDLKRPTASVLDALLLLLACLQVQAAVPADPAPTNSIPAALTSAAATGGLFREGFDAYASGAYDEAATAFQELAQRAPSAGTYHNLGNAEWKRGRTGEAILAWERGQWLDPYAANTRLNLRFARHVAQLPSPQLAWYEFCSTWLPVNAWALLAATSFWLALALVLLPGILGWRKADWHQAVAAASLALFLLSLPALLGVHTRGETAIIRAKDTPLRLTPTREAQLLGKLAAGEGVRRERRRGDYSYVRVGNDAAGWVEHTQCGGLAQPSAGL